MSPRHPASAIACPEPDELWALLDGELDRDRRLALDRHVRRCGACHEALASRSRVNGALFARPDDLMHPTFEDRFRTRLLDRLATGPELRSARRVRRRAAALVAVSVFALIGAALLAHGARRIHADRESRRAAAEPQAEVPTAPTGFVEPALDVLRAEFEAWLRARGEALSERDAPALQSFQVRFENAGSRVLDQLLRLVGPAPDPARLGAVAALRVVGDSSALFRLEAMIRGGAASPREIEAAVAAAVELGGPRSARVVATSVRHGHPLEDAVRTLASLDDPLARSELRGLLDRHRDRLGAIAEALAGYPDDAVTEILFDAWVAGSQSDRHLDALAARPGVLARARRELDAARPRVQRLQVAILLGHLRDAASARSIARFCADEASMPAALAALARIGTPESLLVVARHVAVDDDGRLDASVRRRDAVAADVLRGLSPVESGVFLEAAREGTGSFARRCVVAAALSGGAEAVPALVELAARDDLETAVVRALSRLGGEAGRAALQALSAEDDPRLAATARRALAGR